VEALISQILDGATGGGAYALVVLVLLLCGLGVPMPEDVALITGGYLVFNRAARFDVMCVSAFLGILVGDSMTFMMGRHLGDKLAKRWPFRTIVTLEKRKRVEELFARYGQKIVIAARFMPGVRAVTFFCAGNFGMRYSTFALFDGLAALVSAPVFVFLGFHFGEDIDALIDNVRRGQRAVIGVLVALGLGFGLLHLVRRRRERRGPVLATAEAAPERNAPAAE
jgi:membrane protein DedA with SNARE-associated domain